MTWQLFSFVLLAYYVYRAASAFFDFRRFPAIRAALEISLALIGLWWLVVGSPIVILLSAGIGIAYLPITVGLTSPSLAYVLGFRYKFAEWIFAVVKDRASYLPVLLQTLKEELVWRSAFMYLGRFNNIPDPLLLVVGSILFYLIHWNAKGRVVILTELELLCFSFLLYVVYLELQTLIGVWIIHFIRNSYLRYYRSMMRASEV
ncbi:MAG: CPBP family intramembrane metalloprotease [Proteobacteria bacterium]|nr:CPBP family intramembrane metalloprotease [Bacteroidota bacterium]MBU2483389.1 CPBP family intramembrane metalloprotease [Pseudomonadota bacterium]